MVVSTYAQQRSWQQLQRLLPLSVRLTPDHLPDERWWHWRGNQVHLDWMGRAPVLARILLLHGVGTNGRQMSMLLGRRLQAAQIESVAVDLPDYGMTRFVQGSQPTYDDWVMLVSDLVDHLAELDASPIFLFGLSAGGMLAYHVAATNPNVRGVAGLSFLDQRVQAVRDGTALCAAMARFGGPLVAFAARTPLASLKLPMRLAGNMGALANDAAAMRLFRADKTSAANWVSVRFLESYLTFAPEVEPEEFSGCPLVFLQPECDRWTPPQLSEIFLSRIARVPVLRATLRGAGHYPMEDPGLTQLGDALIEMVTRHYEAPNCCQDHQDPANSSGVQSP